MFEALLIKLFSFPTFIFKFASLLIRSSILFLCALTINVSAVMFCYDSLFQNYLIDYFSKNKIGYWCIIFIIVIGYNVMELQPIICLCTCHAYALVRCVQVFEDICTTLESFKISQRPNYFNICNCRFFILCIFYFAHIHTYIHGPVASKHGN